MIVQCHSCGAPLDVSGRTASVVCAYCKAKQRVRALTVQQPLTPPNWQPPPTWSSPAGHLQYRPTAARSGNYALISLLAALVVSGASAGIFVVGRQASTNDARTVDVEAPATNAAPVAVTPDATARATAATAEPMTLFMDARPVLAGYAARFGTGAKFLSLSLYPDYAHAQIATPGRSDAVDRYTYRAAGIGEPLPMNLGQNVKKRLDKCLFSVASIDASAVPRMAEDALRTAPNTGGAVTHMMLRTCPFTDTPTWTVFVGDSHGSVTSEYDLSGRRTDGRGAASGPPPSTKSPAGAQPGAAPTPAPAPAQPPRTPAPKGPCGCATDDAMCAMRCSKRK